MIFSRTRPFGLRPSPRPSLSGRGAAQWALVGALSLLGGCAAQDLSDETQRDLSEGSFEYRCVGENDAFDPCGQDNAFPETLAVGAQFMILFHDEEGQEHQVVSAAPERLEVSKAQRFEVLESGYLGVLALSSEPEGERRALDFLHLNAKPVERVGLREIDGDEDLRSLSLMHGQVRTIIARPYAAGTKQVAAGALPYEWASSNSNILQVEALPNARTVGLVARQPGSAMLTVYQGDIERSIEVTVVAQMALSKDDPA